jgi:hypothetical protein
MVVDVSRWEIVLKFFKVSLSKFKIEILQYSIFKNSFVANLVLMLKADMTELNI